MTKNLLLLLLFFAGFDTFSQGTLRLSVYKNDTGLLTDNMLLDSVEAEIYLAYSEKSERTFFTFTNSNKNCLLRGGLYVVEVKISPKKSVKICEVLIREFEATFLSVLIEPELKLSKKQLRQRKHFDNFRKTACK